MSFPMTLSRSTILCTAHAATRARMAPLRHCWAGYELDRARNRFYPTFTYKQAFKEELRKAWVEAKSRARLDAIVPVEIPLTDAQRAEVERLERLADWQPITFTGNERCAALRLQAACIRNEAARASMTDGLMFGSVLLSKVHSGWTPRGAQQEARG